MVGRPPAPIASAPCKCAAKVALPPGLLTARRPWRWRCRRRAGGARGCCRTPRCGRGRESRRPGKGRRQRRYGPPCPFPLARGLCPMRCCVHAHGARAGALGQGRGLRMARGRTLHWHVAQSTAAPRKPGLHQQLRVAHRTGCPQRSPFAATAATQRARIRSFMVQIGAVGQPRRGNWVAGGAGSAILGGVAEVTSAAASRSADWNGL